MHKCNDLYGLQEIYSTEVSCGRQDVSSREDEVTLPADRCCMFHKQIVERLRTGEARAGGPQLVTNAERNRRSGGPKALPELLNIAARRCSAFCAEAAVLVLVFGVLDFMIQKGHIDSAWVAGALGISVLLLMASVATEFSARRWLGAQP